MNLKNKYLILIVSILALVVSSQLVIQYFMHQKESDARVINMAGRQRMLSQRINLLAYRSAHGDARSKAELPLTLNEWHDTHLSLLGRDAKSDVTIDSDLVPDMESALEKINLVKSICSNSDSLNEERLEQISLTINSFLTEMEAILLATQILSDQRLDWLKRLEVILTLVTILVISLEMIWIILPGFNQLIDQNESLKDIAWHQAHVVRKHVANILGLVQIIRSSDVGENDKSKAVEALEETTEKLDTITREIIKGTEKSGTS